MASSAANSTATFGAQSEGSAVSIEVAAAPLPSTTAPIITGAPTAKVQPRYGAMRRSLSQPLTGAGRARRGPLPAGPPST